MGPVYNCAPVSALDLARRRFDLILILLDSPNKDWDKRVSTYLLQQAVDDGVSAKERERDRGADADDGRKRRHGFEGATSPHTKVQVTSTGAARAAGAAGKGTVSSKDVWSIDTLSQYIAYVKHKYQPVMSPPARYLLTRFYYYRRQSDDRSSALTTVRLLESLLRLSEAHAKLMGQDKVEIHDAVIAIVCVSLSQTPASVFGKQGRYSKVQ